MNILKLSKIIEDFIDDHKELEHVGSGMMLDKIDLEMMKNYRGPTIKEREEMGL